MAQYPDAANPDLLDRIPLSARSVLDVGCGTGAMGMAYRRRNPRARLLGLDHNVEALSVARGRLDRVWHVDLDKEPVPFATDVMDGGLDCIIYGDVLEHLRDPWSVLKAQAELLAEDGTVLVCMPNVEHWRFVERLLRGTWDYEQQGLFDATHLRWFSAESTRRALLAAGLHPTEVIPRAFPRAEAEAFVEAMRPALERLGIDPGSYLSRATPLQHVWRAQRRPVGSVFVASTMLEPVGGVSDVRVIEPLTALRGEPGLLPRIVSQFDMPEVPPDLPHIYILHRPLLVGEQGLETIRRLISRGWVVVCEFDDHPDYIPVLQRPDVQNFRAVHAIQTSTEPLADVLRERNPEIAVFPNAVASLPNVVNYADPNRLTLFFAGINREGDWPVLVPGLNAAAQRAGERLHFRIVADRGLYDAIDSPFKEYHPLVDYPTYRALLADSEISFMPLADTPFNRCKSDLKFIEASAHRVTALASPVVYAGSIADGRTGLLFRDADELAAKLLRLVTTPELGRNLADAARAYVAGERMLAYQVARRAAWYRGLWQRREELHRELLTRVPELVAQPVA